MYKIYKITNKINEKIYIGSTSASLEKRFKQHISNSKLKNAPILEAIRTLGEENFEIELIKSVETKEESKFIETEIIKKSINEGLELYNIHKESNISSTFYSYDLITKEIKEYENMNLLSRHSPGKISLILNNSISKDGYKRFTHDGKLWSYINEKDNWEKLIKENSKKGEMPNKRNVENVTTGEVFNSCRDAAKSCGLKNSVSISEACSGRKKTAGGFVWRYI